MITSFGMLPISKAIAYGPGIVAISPFLPLGYQVTDQELPQTVPLWRISPGG
jgi:hypothetical protein